MRITKFKSEEREVPTFWEWVCFPDLALRKWTALRRINAKRQ